MYPGALVRLASIGLGLGSVAPAAPPVQDPAEPAPIVAVVERFFDALRRSDTAATRAFFLPNARILPVPPSPAQAVPPGLSVDQFVAFAGRNPAGSWIERIWSPSVHRSGPLADLWFSYDLYHGAAFGQCGVNGVQMVETGEGWKILAMTFTAVKVGCAEHPAPDSSNIFDSSFQFD